MNLSRRVFLLWFVLLVIPYGLLVMLLVVGTLYSVFTESGVSKVDDLLLLSGIVLATIPFGAGFHLSTKFARFGSEGLRQTGATCWMLMNFGAVIPAICVVLYGVSFWRDIQIIAPSPEANPFSLLTTMSRAVLPGVLLAPLLIPYVHLVIAKPKHIHFNRATHN